MTKQVTSSVLMPMSEARTKTFILFPFKTHHFKCPTEIGILPRGHYVLKLPGACRFLGVAAPDDEDAKSVTGKTLGEHERQFLLWPVNARRRSCQLPRRLRRWCIPTRTGIRCLVLNYLFLLFLDKTIHHLGREDRRLTLRVVGALRIFQSMI
jgi:hypothetical protein